MACSCLWLQANSSISPKRSLIDLMKSFETDEVLIAHIEKSPRSLNEADEDGKTVLMWAVEKGREVVIRKCYENGVYAEATDNDGWTAMMYATRRGNVDVIKILLDFGASLNHATKDGGFTALHLAAGNELIDVCLSLIKAGANPNVRDSDGLAAADYLKDPRNKEKLLDCMSLTYKDRSFDQIHKHRVEAGTEKSISVQKFHSGKYTAGVNVGKGSGNSHGHGRHHHSAVSELINKEDHVSDKKEKEETEC